MAVRVAVPPELEPVSVETALEHLRLQGDEALAESDRVQGLIVSARQRLEAALWRALIAQTIDLTLPCFPHGPIEVPRGRLFDVEEGSAVTWVKYVDPSGNPQTLSTSAYRVDAAGVPGLIWPAHGTTWPAAREQFDAVQVRAQVGWSRDDLPQPLKQATLLLVSGLYDADQADEAAALALVSAYSLRVP